MHPKTLYLYTMIAGFTAGIFVASIYDVTFFVVGVGLVAVGVSVCLTFFIRHKYVVCFVVFVALFFCGSLRFLIFESRHVPDKTLEGEKIDITAQIVSIPKKENSKIGFYVKSKDIDGNVKVTTNGIEARRGDIVRIQGKLALPENFETDTGREFDYIRYLKKDNVLYQVSFATVSIEKHSWSPIGIFGYLHNSFLEKINSTTSYPESALLAGILLGAESDIPKSTEDDFRNVGLVHIMVLSGYNISIVTKFVQIFSNRLNRKMKIIIDLGFVFLFVCFVGATATVVRAGVMAALANISSFAFRKQSTFHILLVAGFFMILHNPFILMFDPSFELSWLATAGLVLLSKPYEHFFKYLPSFYKIKETVSTSLATNTFVLPLIVYFSGIVSPVSLLANIIVLPLMPMVMLLGFLSGALGFISSFLALPFGLVASLITSFVLLVAKWGASMPYAFFSINGVSGVFILCLYGVLSVTVWYFVGKGK